MIEEPSEEQTIQILKGVREAFENHHNLIISDEAIEASVKLSKRYINDRFLPDKAIDLVDEAASLLSIHTKQDNDTVKNLQKTLEILLRKKKKL